MKTPAGLALQIAVILVAALVEACTPRAGTFTTGSPDTAATAAQPPATATPMATATVRPAPSAMVTDAPTVPAAVATPPPSMPTPAEGQPPPLAELALASGPHVPGKQGSWCYGSGCADIIVGPAAVLPRLELPEPSGGIELSLPAPHRFVHWRAAFRHAADETAPETLLGEGGTRPDEDVVPPAGTTAPPGLTSVIFDGPPSGSWVLRISVAFAGGLGDAAYYWHAVVP